MKNGRERETGEEEDQEEKERTRREVKQDGWLLYLDV